MNRQRSVRRRLLTTAFAVLAGALALSGCSSIYDLPLPGGANVGSNPLTLHVKFRDVLDLVPQSTVKVDDVTVGRVTAIKLQGYTADVTIKVPRNMKIPSNEQATIEQTSLLGEKFIDLKKPAKPSGTLLTSGDVIPLSQTGRNPEVEEVLGALSALLNGGGVAQLKTIAGELNTAVGGREQDVRAVLDQIHSFMGQLDANKTQVLGAIDHLNTLSIALHKQDGTIKQTLADLPSAIASVNTQRADLRKLLAALSRLSNVGVKVIEASKASTIDSLSELAPVLTAFADSGQNLPKSLQVFLTYPFIDAAVGNSPVEAKNLHLGDYVNLNAQLDLDLNQLVGGIGIPGLTLPGLVTICNGNVPAQLTALCGALNSVSTGICAIPGLSTSPLCDDGSASSSPVSNLKKSLSQASSGTSADQNAADQVRALLGNLFGTGGLGSSSSSSASGSSGASSGASPSPSSPSSGTGATTGSGLSGLLSGLGLGRTAPAYDRKSMSTTVDRLHGLAGVGTLLLQGVYS